MTQETVTGPAQGGLSLTQAVAIGVNTTSPAFSLAAILVPMALLVGYSTPIVIIVSFIPMALTSLAFMYLNRRDPDCGTTFSWVTRAIGPRSGFMAGWAIAAAGILVLGSLAETAITYGLRTVGLNGLADNRTLVIACAATLIIVMTGLSILGTDSSIRMQTVLTYVQVGILLAFAIAAGVVVMQGAPVLLTSEWVNPLSHGVGPLTSAMLLGVFAFWGWEAATNLAEECRRPSDAGKAGVVSTAILLTTYVLVALSVTAYLAESQFYPVGESGLVLVDMAGVVFGPLAFLVLLAVAVSALASTQSTMVPGSRAVLSMARRGALPARLGLVHPRLKSPWVSLALLGGIAASWYVLVSSVSDRALEDTLSAIGLLVAFTYCITGIACVVYFRKHVIASVRGFLLVGLGPAVGSLGLAFMLVIAVQSVSDPAASASGVPWLGLAPPLAIAALIVGLGLITMLVRRVRKPDFFTRPREAASHAAGPFPDGREVAIEPGGLLIDANCDEATVTQLIAELPDEALTLRPVLLVFGIEPSGIGGDEFGDARDALIDRGASVFRAAEAALRSRGVRSVIRLYEPADAAGSFDRACRDTRPTRVASTTAALDA